MEGNWGCYLGTQPMGGGGGGGETEDGTILYIAKPLGLCILTPISGGTLSQDTVPTAVLFLSQDASPALLLGPCRYRARMTRMNQDHPPSHLPRCHMSGNCSWNIQTRQKQKLKQRLFKYFLSWPSWFLGAWLPVLKAILNVLCYRPFASGLTIRQAGHIFQEPWLFEEFLHPWLLSNNQPNIAWLLTHLSRQCSASLLSHQQTLQCSAEFFTDWRRGFRWYVKNGFAARCNGSQWSSLKNLGWICPIYAWFTQPGPHDSKPANSIQRAAQSLSTRCTAN